ncbi:MAG: hypothetical protein ACLFWM_02500 [Actinomycetota bacterium]
MTTAASGDHARPPSERIAASSPEAAVRPTVRPRPQLPTRLVSVSHGFPPDDPYVRRYWVAAIGRGAVTELLRLIRAAADEQPVPLPAWLPQLIRSDLVRVDQGSLIVTDRIPPVPRSLRRRFPPGLREEHRRLFEEKRRP